MGGNTDTASRRLSLSRFCFFAAHWLSRDVGFIIVCCAVTANARSLPPRRRLCVGGTKQSSKQPQDRRFRTPLDDECSSVSGRRSSGGEISCVVLFFSAVLSFPRDNLTRLRLARAQRSDISSPPLTGPVRPGSNKT